MAGTTNFFATSDETESRFYRFLNLIAKGGVYKSADKDFHPFKGTSYQEKTKQAHFFMDALSPQSLYEFSYGRAKLLTLPGLSYSPYNLNPLAFAHAVHKMLPTDLRRSLLLYHLIATKDVGEDDTAINTYQNGLQYPLSYYASHLDTANKDEALLTTKNLRRYLTSIHQDILLTQDASNESIINSTQLFDSAFGTLQAMGVIAPHPTTKDACDITPNPISESNLTEEERKELVYALDFQKYLSPISSYAHYVQFKLSLRSLDDDAPEDILSDINSGQIPQVPSPILVRQVPPFKTLLDDKRLSFLAGMNTWTTVTTIDRSNPKSTSKLHTTKTIVHIDNLEEHRNDSREYIYSTSKHGRPMSPISLDAVHHIDLYPSTPHSRKQTKPPTTYTVYFAFHSSPYNGTELQQALHQFRTKRLSIDCMHEVSTEDCLFLVKVTYLEPSAVLPLLYQWGPYLHFATSTGEPLTEDDLQKDPIKTLQDLVLTRVRSIVAHYES